MSVSSLVRIAVERSSPRSTPAGFRGPPPDPRASAASGREGDATDVQPSVPVPSADSLLALVPTEVVGAYIAMLGVLAGVLKDSPENEYVPLRWVLWGGGAAAVVIAVLVGFIADKGSDVQRKLPVLELVAGVVAFLAWGIVIPDSALYYVLGPPTLPVIVGVVTAGGVFLASAVFQPLLKRKVKRARDGET